MNDVGAVASAKVLVSVLAFVALLTAVACNSHSPTTPSSTGASSGVPGFSVAPPSGGVAQFTVLPVDVSVPDSLTALGALNPPGHTVPTDHVYFYQGSLSTLNPFGPGRTRNVLAPTRATVLQIITVPPAYKIVFIVTPTFQFYFDGVMPRAGLTVGTVVNAGDVVGTSNTTLDFGAFDYGITLSGFVTPSRYGDQTLHCVSPWKYFVEPLRSRLYSYVYRAPSAPDRDGRIDDDVPGRLAGMWYDPSVPATGGDASWGPTSWAKSLAFAYSYYDPSQVQIAIGGTIAPQAGVWLIDPSAPHPADVSVGTGRVAYHLRSLFDAHAEYGVMLVQLLTDTTIKVEVFPGTTVAPADFDGNAFTWVR